MPTQNMFETNCLCRLDVPLEPDSASGATYLRDRARRARRLAYEACLQEEDTRRLLAYAKELEDRAVAAEGPDLVLRD
jgi:hypothetical protein